MDVICILVFCRVGMTLTCVCVCVVLVVMVTCGLGYACVVYRCAVLHVYMCGVLFVCVCMCVRNIMRIRQMSVEFV